MHVYTSADVGMQIGNSLKGRMLFKLESIRGKVMWGAGADSPFSKLSTYGSHSEERIFFPHERRRRIGHIPIALNRCLKKIPKL